MIQTWGKIKKSILSSKAKAFWCNFKKIMNLSIPVAVAVLRRKQPS